MKLRSLRWEISALFVFVVLLVTASSAAFGILQGSDEIERNTVDRQQSAGASAATGIAYFLEASGRSLGSAAASLPASDFRPTIDQRAVGNALDPLVAHSQDFAAALLVDAHGEVLLARPVQSSWLAVDFADEPAFAQALESHAPRLSLRMQGHAPYWVVPIQSLDADPAPYVLVGVLNLGRLEEILFANLLLNADALLLDEQQNVIVSTDPDLPAAGATALAADTDTGEAIVTRSPLPEGHPATVTFMTPRTEIASLQSVLVRNALVASVSLAGGAIVIGTVLAARITRPVDDVRDAARRMRAGDLSVRAKPRGARELQDLANDFNAMADNLSAELDQRMRLQNHLEELVEERTRELDAKRKEMELFFYGVSHDFKSPVISISNISQMAEERLSEKKLDRAELLAMVQRVRRSSAALSRLTGELLQFAQAERAAPRYETLEAHDALTALAEESRPLARQRGIRFEVGGDRGPLETDPDRLRHILANLVENAVKYMPERKNALIRVSWRRLATDLEIRVADNGVGIPAPIQESLFRPFARHEPKGASAPGVGLGLSIVKRMAESLRGSVAVDSIEGRGSTFIVRLPLARPAETRPA